MSSSSITKLSPTLYKAVINPSTPNASNPLEITLFINHYSEVPFGFFDIDFFGSGELYCDFLSTNLISLKSTMTTLYGSYLFNESSDLSSLPPSVGYTSKSLSFAVSVPSTLDSSLLSWRFPLETFFEFSSVEKQHSICSYYTYSSSNTPVHISSRYKFANVIEGYPTCSHPSTDSNPNPVNCPFSSSSFPSCSFYTPTKKTLLSTTLTPSNSSQSLTFELNYSITTDSSHVFSIENKTLGQQLNTLTFPSSVVFSYEECESEAIKIYNEYLETYSTSSYLFSDNEISSDQQTEEIKKPSYINSIMTV